MRFAREIVPTFLAGIVVLSSVPFVALALVFLNNFHFPNLWHLLVFTFTLGMPLITVSALVFYRIRPSRLRAITFYSCCVLNLCTYFLWVHSSSNGLIH